MDYVPSLGPYAKHVTAKRALLRWMHCHACEDKSVAKRGIIKSKLRHRFLEIMLKAKDFYAFPERVPQEGPTECSKDCSNMFRQPRRTHKYGGSKNQEQEVQRCEGNLVFGVHPWLELSCNDRCFNISFRLSFQQRHVAKMSIADGCHIGPLRFNPRDPQTRPFLRKPAIRCRCSQNCGSLPTPQNTKNPSLTESSNVHRNSEEGSDISCAKKIY